MEQGSVPVVVNERTKDESTLTLIDQLQGRLDVKLRVQENNLTERAPVCLYTILLTTDRLSEQVDHEKLALAKDKAGKVIVVLFRKGSQENTMTAIAGDQLHVHAVRTVYWFKNSFVQNDFNAREMHKLTDHLQPPTDRSNTDAGAGNKSFCVVC
eukprot:TRINITY_DN8971_c0_g1_i1.p1 TRINITY_DN8971_c0_g1~~TRINITY_DN8971_c0_g1_i1.p1  ORF type:complete len:155 (+),score=20.54 TRINITY_DN8971_c0_g1_i1:2-466(+)